LLLVVASAFALLCGFDVSLAGVLLVEQHRSILDEIVVTLEDAEIVVLHVAGSHLNEPRRETQQMRFPIGAIHKPDNVGIR